MSYTDDWLMEIEAAALAAIENEVESKYSGEKRVSLDDIPQTKPTIVCGMIGIILEAGGASNGDNLVSINKFSTHLLPFFF